MPRVPNPKVEDQIAREDIWEDDLTAWWDDDYREDIWDGVVRGEMSWQWYLTASYRREEGWKYVVISNDHKNITVCNWLVENYPDCEYENEGTHFMIDDEQAAMMVALKFS